MKITCVYQTGVDEIFYCGGCRQLVRKKFIGIKHSLSADLDFKSALCLGATLPVDSRLVKEVMVADETLEVA